MRTCEGCQFYARKTHLPDHALQTIPITWLFAMWGLDLVGPLKKAPGGFTHLLVAVDKFSKRIEARPIGRIKSEQAVLFFTDIVFRFGVPNSIITDNGTSSQARGSWRSATVSTYVWTGRLWRTHRRMGKWSVPMA